MTIELDKSVSSRLNDGMQLGGGIELPFFAPVIWCMNGDARLKQLGGASYFGGWACKAEDIEAAKQMGNPIPHGFTLGDITAADGKSFAAYTSRSVLVAPIAVRTAWVTQAGTRTAHFVQGGRQHTQAVCYLASKNGETSPWGPVVLSAKGFQAKNLSGAFSAWSKHTASLRHKIAPDVPAWCFYLAVGTFGNDRKQVMVGKSSQSPITPISAYLPDNLTEETMTKLFVGQKIAEAMVQYLDDSKEWLDAWNIKDSASAVPAAAGDDGFFPDEQPPMEDIPF